MVEQAKSSSEVYVLGAGPAGLAAAYQLSKQGRSVVVIECEDHVGGLAKSITYEGFILDYGPHRFFTKIPAVLALWDEVLGDEQVTVRRLTRIYYGRQYFRYPLRAFEALFTLGFWESVRIIFSYLRVRLWPIRHPANFAQWVTNQFGHRLFEIFFEGYTEKLWGIPCAEISAAWAAQRIKGLSLFSAVRNALLGNSGKVKSLVDQFQFPRLGSGQLYDRIQTYLEDRGHRVRLHTEVVQIHHDQGDVWGLTLRDRQTGATEQVSCGAVISSIPLTQLVQQMEPAPPPVVKEAARSLRFRNTVLVYLLVAGGDLFPDNWLYINDPTVAVGRVTNFANWSPAMLPTRDYTPLCCEYWCNFEDERWQDSEDRLIALATAELRQIGLLRQEAILGGFVKRLPRTYPIYAGDYEAALATLQDYLAGLGNLQAIGRYGAFKYNNQDHSLLMGILAAENVTHPHRHDLWQVNADTEYQEEVRSPQAPIVSAP